MASDQSSQSFLTEGSLSKPAIELIPLTAKGIPHCRIIFPVSVNNFSTAFPDSYASDLLISPCLVFFFFIYDIDSRSVAVHHGEIGMLENIEYFINMHV